MASAITPTSYDYLITEDKVSPKRLFLTSDVRRTIANKLYLDLGTENGLDDNPSNLPVMTDNNLAAFILFNKDDSDYVIHCQVAVNNNIIRYTMKVDVKETEIEIDHYIDYNDIL